MLHESFHPRRSSFSLDEPLACLTSDLLISGRQWLFQAIRSSPMFSLNSGLLHWQKSCLFESNPSTLHSRPTFLHNPGKYPPGWWHRNRKVQLRPESITLLSTHNNPNYFHWLTQPGLAPLFLESHFGLCIQQQSVLALSHRPRQHLPKFVEPLLSIIAPDAPRVIAPAIASSSLCRFSLQQHYTDVFVSPAQILWLRNLFHSKLRLKCRPWRRIYLSRNNAKTRRCLNEPQVLSALTPYGFQRHCLESLSVDAQLRLFSESSVVVGPHGAGFSNLIACMSSAAIVELIPRPGSFSHYYAMADQLDLRHGHLLASKTDAKSDNFTIDTGKLISLLRLMELI